MAGAGTLVKEIREVNGGYIVEARWPYGERGPFGDLCFKDFVKTFNAMIEAEK